MVFQLQVKTELLHLQPSVEFFEFVRVLGGVTVFFFISNIETLLGKTQCVRKFYSFSGRKVAAACRYVPKTCGLLERYPETTSCKRGQVSHQKSVTVVRSCLAVLLI